MGTYLSGTKLFAKAGLSTRSAEPQVQNLRVYVLVDGIASLIESSVVPSSFCLRSDDWSPPESAIRK